MRQSSLLAKTVILVSAVDPPRARAGVGDHERALRRILSGESSDQRLKARIEAQNRLIPHQLAAGEDRDLICDHPGCQAIFTVRLVPGQIVYPRWCPEHRTPHRRSLTCRDRLAAEVDS